MTTDPWPNTRRLVDSLERAGLATPEDRAQVRSVEPDHLRPAPKPKETR